MALVLVVVAGCGGTEGEGSPGGGSGPSTHEPSAADCNAQQVFCSGHCQSKMDPYFGCGTCEPCPTLSLPGGSAVCSQENVCNEVLVCMTGRADCDGLKDTGCEVELAFDPLNCGACDNACSAPNAESYGCGVGDNGATACIILGCEDGFSDVDGAYDNGCERER